MHRTKSEKSRQKSKVLLWMRSNKVRETRESGEKECYFSFKSTGGKYKSI